MYMKLINFNIIYMNKAALAQNIAEKVGVTKKEAEEMISAFVTIVTSTLEKNGEVNIAGFGSFSSRVRKGRIGVNPQNPSEKIQVPPVKVAKFKPGKGLKDSLKHS
jgi:DNA-binding protein HU-beta